MMMYEVFTNIYKEWLRHFYVSWVRTFCVCVCVCVCVCGKAGEENLSIYLKGSHDFSAEGAVIQNSKWLTFQVGTNISLQRR